ncbi:MAG: sulfotransferase domain-containing protein [Candidatus Competibacterales bacterium]
MRPAIIHRLIRIVAVALARPLGSKRSIPLERYLRGFEERHQLSRADGCVVSFGKSGRTWVRVMLQRYAQHPALDPLQRRRQVFFTHDNYLADYTGQGDSKAVYGGLPVVLLVRDPRDVVVSQYFQWRHRMRPVKKRLNGYPSAGEDLTPFAFAMHPAGLAKVVNFLNTWALGLQEIDRVHVVRYEDLRADTAKALEGIIAHLGFGVHPPAIDDAVAFAAFENMQRREGRSSWLASRRLAPGDRRNPDSFKTRRAVVGGYRDYFTAEEMAAIDAYLQAHLAKAFGYTPHNLEENPPLTASPTAQGLTKPLK